VLQQTLSIRDKRIFIGCPDVSGITRESRRFVSVPCEILNRLSTILSQSGRRIRFASSLWSDEEQSRAVIAERRSFAQKVDSFREDIIWKIRRVISAIVRNCTRDPRETRRGHTARSREARIAALRRACIAGVAKNSRPIVTSARTDKPVHERRPERAARFPFYQWNSLSSESLGFQRREPVLRRADEDELPEAAKRRARASGRSCFSLSLSPLTLAVSLSLSFLALARSVSRATDKSARSATPA